MGPTPDRVREKVEDFAALTAAIFDHRPALAFMGSLPLGEWVPRRTMQPVGVQRAPQILITLLFIQEIGDRELHHVITFLTFGIGFLLQLIRKPPFSQLPI